MANLIIGKGRPRRLESFIAASAWRRLSSRAKVIFEFFHGLAEGTAKAIAAGDAHTLCCGYHAMAQTPGSGELLSRQAYVQQTLEFTVRHGGDVENPQILCCLESRSRSRAGHFHGVISEEEMIDDEPGRRLLGCVNLPDNYYAANREWLNLCPIGECSGSDASLNKYEHFSAYQVAILLADGDWEFGHPNLTDMVKGKELDEGKHLPSIPGEISMDPYA